jgi:hypothetical protein
MPLVHMWPRGRLGGFDTYLSLMFFYSSIILLGLRFKDLSLIVGSTIHVYRQLIFLEVRYLDLGYQMI